MKRDKRLKVVVGEEKAQVTQMSQRVTRNPRRDSELICYIIKVATRFPTPKLNAFQVSFNWENEDSGGYVTVYIICPYLAFISQTVEIHLTVYLIIFIHLDPFLCIYRLLSQRGNRSNLI
jgi:hypothetical protein